MKITKLEHSGLAIEKDHKVVLCDPVEFKTILPIFDNIVAIVITHKHSDHFQPELLMKLRTAHPTVEIFAPADTTPLLSGTITIHDGETRELDGFKLTFFGKNHAAVVADQIPCENIGVIIDDLVANPGDAFTKPPIEHPKVLCVPVSAPWCKISESVDYIKDVHPESAIPVHDAVLSDLGKTFSISWLESACSTLNIKLDNLAPGAFIEI